MEKPNPLNSSSGFHRGRRKDTRKGLVSSTSSRRNTCKNKKCKTIRRSRRHGRKHITRKISGGGSGELYVVVKYNDNDKPNDFKFEIDRVEYPGGTINWRKKGKSVALYRELVGKLKGVTGNMGSSKTPVASYTPGGPLGQGMGGPGVGANSGYNNSYGSMTNNSYGMSNNANTGNNTGKNTGNNTGNNINKPSKKFCETGVLEDDEEYNQNIHNLGKTPKERCSKYYNEYLDNTISKNNVDLLVDRIDEVKDPKTKEAAPIYGKDTTKFTPVEKIDTNFLDTFDIHNDIEKKDEFIKKINELPTVINSNFEKLNDLINENITNNDITIQWRKFLTDINQYANNNKKDSNFLKFQSSSSDDNHYYHMNDRITRAEKLFIENKSNIKNLIEVDYKNKAFNIPGSSLTSKIDKLKNYYNKLITDINSDNTKIKVLIEKYNSKSIDNSRFTITKIKNVFTKDELTQIENLTKNMKAKTDSINNFLEKCSNVIKKVIEEIFEMINLITTCKIIINKYYNNQKIQDLLTNYKINIKLDNTNNTNTNTYNNLTTKNVKDAMNKHINNNNIVGNIVIWFDKKINNFVAGIINKIKIINDKIIVENATSLNGINNNITEDEDQVIVPIKLVKNNLDTQLKIAEKTISSAIDNNISLENITYEHNTHKLLTKLQEEVFASLENNKEDDNSFKENFKLAMALKMFDENDENDENAQNLSQLPQNTINNYSLNNNSNTWERYH